MPRTAAISPPRLVRASAKGPRQVRLFFDVAVGVVGARVTLTPQTGPAVTPEAAVAAVAGEVVDLELGTEMTPDVLYEVQAADVTDLANNPVAAPFDRTSFVGFRPARPAARRFTLWEMLPKHNRRDDATGDLSRLMACLQEVTDLLLANLDSWPDIFDFERAPESFVDLILRDLGNPFPFELDLRSKRRLASVLVEMYRQKGTAPGIESAVRFFLGIDVVSVRAYSAETLVLGVSPLDTDWVLGPSTRFARYAFDVVVGRALTPLERRQLRVIVEYLKPAHSHFIDLVEPGPPPGPNHWDLGISLLAQTSILH